MSTTVNTTSASTPGNSAQNPLKGLLKFGQSVWLDYIRRDLFTGELKKMIENDGLRGMTSNPSIFEKAITGSTLYAQTLKDLEQRKDLDAKGRYEQLALVFEEAEHIGLGDPHAPGDELYRRAM